MDRKTFKEIVNEVPKPIRLSKEMPLPYVFDLYWDCKTVGDLYQDKLMENEKVLRLLAEHGFDVRKKLPPIEIPYKDSSVQGKGEAPCLICGKNTNKEKVKWVLLEDGGGRIVDPNTEEPNHGAFPIGMGCWKKNKQLHPYSMD